MITITPQELERDFAQYLDRVKAGETLVVQRGVEPRIDSNTGKLKLRPYGLAKGEFVVPDDFNDPLPDDILEAIEGDL